MKKWLGFAMMLAIMLFANNVYATDELLFDSTDHYLGGCQLTDKSEWILTENLDVGLFQIWYKWADDETTLPVKVFKDGAEFASFDATRTTCDTYQKSWCNADFELNKTMPAGTYTTQVEKAQQCLKPGGTGTVRLYAQDSSDIARTSPENDKKTSRVWTYVSISGGVIVFLVLSLYILKKNRSK